MNSEALEKVVEENEILVEDIGRMRNELSDLNKRIEGYEKETINTVESRIKELKEKQEREYEILKQEHRKNLRNEERRLQKEEMERESILEEKVNIANTKCNEKRKKTKDRLEKRCKELSDAIDSKLAEAASKRKESETTIKRHEVIFRQEWEKAIRAKFASEYAAKRAELRRKQKQEQEEHVLHMIGELELESKKQTEALTKRMAKEKSDHVIYMKRLQKKLTMRQIPELDENLEKEVYELQKQADKCNCSRYRSEISEITKELNQIDDLLIAKRCHNDDQSQYEALHDVSKRLSQQKIDLLSELQEADKALDESRTDGLIEDITNQHKSKLAEISHRVKATIVKKDEIIADLRSKLAEYTIV